MTQDTAISTEQMTSLTTKTVPKAGLGTIYLDYHATTPIDPLVLQEMMPYLTDDFGNPASSHSFGVRAQYAVEIARQKTAVAIGAHPEEVLFTSGATESNNFVIKGVMEASDQTKPHLIVSNIEHKCVLEAAKHAERQGASLTILPVTKTGLITPEALERALTPQTVLVSIMWANNEVGSINDIASLAAVCRRHRVLFHTDAAQAVGKVPIDAESLGIDFLSASGHKFYAPKGVGFVYIRSGAKKQLTPLLDGGGQEAKLRSGTLNVPSIVGLGRAIELSDQHMQQETKQYAVFRDRLYKKLAEAFPDMLLNGPPLDEGGGNKRLPHNLNVTLPSVSERALSRIYDVAFSSTSACSSGEAQPSYVLRALGRTNEQALRSLRFGIGRYTTEEEIDTAASRLIAGLRRE